MLKGKKLDSISSKKTDKKKSNESKIKLIKRIAGRMDWVALSLRLEKADMISILRNHRSLFPLKIYEMKS